MTMPENPVPVWSQFPHEVWFTYGEARRYRACRSPEERDEAIALLESTPGVTDITVIERA